MGFKNCNDVDLTSERAWFKDSCLAACKQDTKCLGIKWSPGVGASGRKCTLVKYTDDCVVEPDSGSVHSLFHEERMGFTTQQAHHEELWGKKFRSDWSDLQTRQCCDDSSRGLAVARRSIHLCTSKWGNPAPDAPTTPKRPFGCYFDGRWTRFNSYDGPITTHRLSKRKGNNGIGVPCGGDQDADSRTCPL